jgi:hypothetical protein
MQPEVAFEFRLFDPVENMDCNMHNTSKTKRRAVSRRRNETVMRCRKGNILILIIVAICFILLPLLIVVSQLGFFQIDRDRTQNIVDAAGLIAANDLSRIILNDENFGYVSLSNYPPVGKETLADDGEPLPVTGINTLIGTIRQNAIIARELGNETMEHLSETDRVNAQKQLGI